MVSNARLRYEMTDIIILTIDSIPGGILKMVYPTSGAEKALKSHGKEAGGRNAKEILLSTQ